MPMPWDIPSFPQVHIPPHLLDYNQQFYGNINPPMFAHSPADWQLPEMHDDVAEVDHTPIPHPPILHPHVIQSCYPSSNMSAFLPEFKHPMLSLDGDVLLPPGAEDKRSREPDLDAFLPSDVRDTASLGEPVARTENPEDGLTFRHYRGPSDRQGRKVSI